MFFFFNDYKDELREATELPHIKELADSEEFYFEKAKIKFEEFSHFDTSNIDLVALIEDTKQSGFSFENWLNSYDEETYEYKLLLLIGQIISYFDTNAAMKNKLNEYQDKRVLAKAMVRQNIWVKWLLKFKLGADINTFPGNIRNAILFIQRPEANINIISDDYRKNISEKLFNGENPELFEGMKNLGIVAKNTLNNGVLYTWILYSDSIKELWFEPKGKTSFDLESEFRNWCLTRMSASSANHYISELKNVNSNLKIDADLTVDIFSCSSFGELEEIRQFLENISEYQKRNDRQNGWLRTGLNNYSKFLKERVANYVPVTTKPRLTTQSNSSFLKWFEPLITSLIDLGGSGTPAEVRDRIQTNMGLSDDEISATRGNNNVNKFANEVAFARQYLVFSGYIDNSVYGKWILTEKGKTSPMNIEIASEIQKEYLKKKDKRYWIYTPGERARLWEDFYGKGIMGIGWDAVGDLSEYPSKSDIATALQDLYQDDKSHKNDTHALWEFANKISIGDVVFVKKGYSLILGRGIVESEYVFDDDRSEYRHIRQVNWTNKGEWEHPGQAVQKTLTDITAYTDYVDKLKALFHDENVLIENEEETIINYPNYTETDFLSKVYISEERYKTLKGLLLRKKNIILQGAPGVGKTFAAKRLAFSIMGKKDTSRVKVIQFHQSYSYEDFIMGWRPNGSEFKLEKGPFYEFCKLAEVDDENEPYFFIIDEINRGNLSKIFGELLMLIECDKRGDSIRLLYKDEQFTVPKNVHVIGMMNTADRSLAMIDYALRRRFAFFDMLPAFQSNGFKEYQSGVDNPKFDNLIGTVERLNAEIGKDASLGNGFKIGHSYFCNAEDVTIDDDWLSDVVEYELIPLLNEYWFDEPQKTDEWSRQLRSAING